MFFKFILCALSIVSQSKCSLLYAAVAFLASTSKVLVGFHSKGFNIMSLYEEGLIHPILNFVL